MTGEVCTPCAITLCFFFHANRAPKSLKAWENLSMSSRKSCCVCVCLCLCEVTAAFSAKSRSLMLITRTLFCLVRLKSLPSDLVCKKSLSPSGPKCVFHKQREKDSKEGGCKNATLFHTTLDGRRLGHVALVLYWKDLILLCSWRGTQFPPGIEELLPYWPRRTLS